MRSFRTLDRRAGFGLSAFALLLAMVAPGLVPAFASADTLQDRSIALSDNSVDASGVTYDVTFKPVAGAGAYIIDFCSNTPIIGAACTAPTDFSTASVNTSTASTTATSVLSGRGVKVVQSLTGGTSTEVVLTGLHNPSVANDSSNGFYARILTYADSTAADGYTDADTAIGSPVDFGGVALSINDTIGVSAAVRESMTFCVASASITDNCANAGSNPPSVVLGDPVQGLSTTIATQALYAQISTNASSGAVVNLKSNTTGCGGLHRAGATGDCDIKPAVAAGVLVNNAAYFGLMTGTATGTDGEFRAINGYSDSDYHLDFVSGDATGITSSYGSGVLDTHDAPANNMNMPLTFGAATSNSTPAGNYSATLSMIATGKY